MKLNYQQFKKKLFAHIETWRPYTVLWCGLLSLTGACLIYNGLPPISHIFLVLGIPIMGWIAGLYLSDYLDAHLDMIQKAHRPIPSGRIHPTEALIIGALFAGIGLSLTILLGIQNLILAFCASFLVYSYARFTKPRGILGNINRGALAVVSFLFGVLSFNIPLYNIPLSIWILCIVFLLHDMNTNLVGTLRDMQSDKEGGYNTISVMYGLKKTVYLAIFLSITWFLLILSIITLLYTPTYLFSVLIFIDGALVLLIGVHLRKLVKTYSRKKALTIHKYFVLERITLASAIISLMVPLNISLTVYITSLILTGLFQITLRNQYEFSKWEL
ncbi:MAG: UbiA family prenyltransferase [Candidatus Thermoplasmatota archaeon]|nr:UbiA family prenyltransferase [Candidatus Thermoplasmatota archaeon]